jgi:predicted P-loop ATPase
MRISLFKTWKVSKPTKQVDLTFAEFCAELGTDEVDEKFSPENVAKLTPDEVAELKKETSAFVPGEMKPDTGREDVNVIAIHALALDFDGPDKKGETKEQYLSLVEALKGKNFVVATSFSHTETFAATGRYKFRVIVELSRPVLRAEWRGFWRRARTLLPIECDPSCVNEARIYGLPLKRSKHDFVHCFEGAPLDVDAILSLPDPAPQESKRTRVLESVIDPDAVADLAKSKGQAAKRRGDVESQTRWRLIAQIAKGKAFAKKDRHLTYTPLIYDLVGEFPNASPEAFAELLRPSLEDTRKDDPAFPVEERLDEIEGSVEGAHRKRQALAEERRAQRLEAIVPGASEDEKKAWEAVERSLKRDDRMKVLASIYNAQLILQHHPHCIRVFGYNTFAQEPTLLRDAPEMGLLGATRAITDADALAVTVWFQEKFENFSVPTIEQAIRHDSMRRQFNPVQDYLRGLTWDGVPRLDKMGETYFGVVPSKEGSEEIDQVKWSRVVFPRFMISAVARAMRPGCKADAALILEGEQGIKKSSALAVLAVRDEWFLDQFGVLGSKESKEQIRGKWIGEMAELDSMNKSDVSSVKAYVTQRFDTYRPAYGRLTKDNPRTCVLAGTVNPETYLTDETGNRRFWPVKCGRIDIDALKADVDQLWAEAVVRYLKPEPWWLTPEEEKELAKPQQDARVKDDVWEPRIAAHVEGKTWVTAYGVLSDCFNIDDGMMNQGHKNRVGSVLKKLGFLHKQRWIGGNKVSGYARADAEFNLTPGAPPPPTKKKGLSELVRGKKESDAKQKAREVEKEKAQAGAR